MRKRKKYNKFKSAGITAKAGLKNLAVVCKTLGNDNGWFYINTKTGNTISRGKSLDFAISKLRHQWGIVTVATGYESKGDRCLKINDVKLMDAQPQNIMTSYIQEDLKGLVRKMRGKSLCNAVWLAIPNGDELTKERIEFLMEKIGAWE